MFQAARGLRGRVCINRPVNVARELILPRLYFEPHEEG